jgi:hypothetical protein
MIDTIYFDNWNTLVKAPELMKRGSSTRIFQEYLGGQGIEVPDNFIDIYVLVARAQNMKAEKDGHREPDYRERLEDVDAGRPQGELQAGDHHQLHGRTHMQGGLREAGLR